MKFFNIFTTQNWKLKIKLLDQIIFNSKLNIVLLI